MLLFKIRAQIQWQKHIKETSLKWHRQWKKLVVKLCSYIKIHSSRNMLKRGNVSLLKKKFDFKT